MAKARVKIPTVNEKLLNRYIRHSVYLEQLKNGEAKLISRFLKQKTFPKIYEKLIAELGRVKDLENVGSIYKLKRLKRMLAATHKISTAGMVKAEKMLVGWLVNVAKFEAQWNKNIIEKTVPLDLDMTMPSNEVLRNLVTMRPFGGHKLGTWMKSYSTAVRVAMVKQVKIGISTGESLPAIGMRINKALNWKGKQAEYIARTAVSNVVHQAKEEVFKKNKAIIRKVQFVATLDDRTSIECIHLDGRMYDVGEGPRPPIHFNCRSTVIPITPSWQEFGVVDPPAATRASMNGAVPAKMNYRQWLKTQPKSVQVKVLGKKRAELYRSGRVKIERFVGKDLKPLNLKQLARREGLDLAPSPPVVETTLTRVGTTFTKTTSANIKKLVDDTIDSYPENVKAALNKNGTSYNIGNSLIEINPTLKGKHPVGWSKGTTWDNVSGMYNMEAKQISIAETYLPKGGRIYAANSKNQIKRMLNHETGHAFDSSDITGMIYSNQNKFKIAYMKDVNALSRTTRIIDNNLQFFMQPGGRGRSEVFADVFGDLMGGGATQGMRKFFPNSAKYIDDILKAKVAPISPKITITSKESIDTLIAEKLRIEKLIKDPKITTTIDMFRDTAAINYKLAELGVDPITLIAEATKVKAEVKRIAKVATVKLKGVIYTKTTSKEFRDLIGKQVDKYPEKVSVALKERGISYKVSNKLTELYPKLKGKHPRGWPRGTTFDSVDGLYETSDKAIVVTETYRPIGKKVFIKTSEKNIKGILNHETGHGFDASPEGLFYSSRPEFKTAYIKDFGAMTRDEMRERGLQYYHQTGTAGRSETFAEIFADIMGQSGRPDGSDIREFFPDTTKYIEGILK